ncbi:S8 family serine peptidase, partial [candidate division KSB3 bacterium]|nr:S8 family serine peptidase [candidate division KSB3 bacterium]MBD3323388.1 S8 family serine peptidase [candidate division KSB3 bacterium]
FMGFTLQTRHVVSNAEELKRDILEPVAKILPESVFSPENEDDYSWDEEMNPDLIEITIGPTTKWGEEEKEIVKEAWNYTYKLRKIKTISYAEPKFALHQPTGDQGGGWLPPFFTDNPQGCNEEAKKKYAMEYPEWHLTQMRVKDAWKLFEKEGKKPGEGVVIALPDSGFLSEHPELDRDEPQNKDVYLEKKWQLLPIAEIVDYVKAQKTDQTEFPLSSFHGTATASLINSSKDGSVTGVAPDATLNRYHLGPTTATTLDKFEFFVPGLVNAINDAVKRADKENIRVISISFGGYPALSLRRAIINAQRKGIIVVASAGNSVPFTIWPGTYADVTSVASSGFWGDTLANHSSRGSRVDVAAPGEYVMVAVPTLDENGKLAYTAEPRCGTSYATPLVAGIAALWVSYWGWDYLLEIYKIPARIPLVFDKLLRQTCSTPQGWNTSRWGAGVVNAKALLDAELPDPEDPSIPYSNPDDPYFHEPLAYREIDHIDLDRGGVDTFTHLFEEMLSKPLLPSTLIKPDPRLEIRINMSEVLIKIFFKESTREKLPHPRKELRQYLRTFGREIAFHFATDVSLYHLMEEHLKILAGLSTENYMANLNEMRAKLKSQASPYLQKYIPG